MDYSKEFWNLTNEIKAFIMEKRKDLVNCDGLQGQWCTRQELNLHFLSKIWTWTIRVCQFRHGCIFNFSLWIFTRLRGENRGGAYHLIHNLQDIVTEMNLHRGGAKWTIRVCQFRHRCVFIQLITSIYIVTNKRKIVK